MEDGVERRDNDHDLRGDARLGRLRGRDMGVHAHYDTAPRGKPIVIAGRPRGSGTSHLIVAEIPGASGDAYAEDTAAARHELTIDEAMMPHRAQRLEMAAKMLAVLAVLFLAATLALVL